MNKIRRVSAIATTYTGKMSPASIPMQKVSAANPTALQPNENNMNEPAFPTVVSTA